MKIITNCTAENKQLKTKLHKGSAQNFQVAQNSLKAKDQQLGALVNEVKALKNVTHFSCFLCARISFKRPDEVLTEATVVAKY